MTTLAVLYALPAIPIFWVALVLRDRAKLRSALLPAPRMPTNWRGVAISAVIAIPTLIWALS